MNEIEPMSDARLAEIETWAARRARNIASLPADRKANLPAGVLSVIAQQREELLAEVKRLRAELERWEAGS